MKSLRAHGLELLLENHTLEQVYSIVTDHKETIDNTYREIQKSRATRTLSDILKNIIAERDDAVVVNLYEQDNPGLVEKAIKELSGLKQDFTMRDLREWLYCYSIGMPYNDKKTPYEPI